MDSLFSGHGFASIGFFMATMAFIRGILPKEILDFVWEYMKWLTSYYIHVHIHEFSGGFDNQLYKAAELYVTTLIWQSHLLNINAALPKNASETRYELTNRERIADMFQGVTFWWIHRDNHGESDKNRNSDIFYVDYRSQSKGENTNVFTLTVARRHKYTVLPLYLEHIQNCGKETEHRKRDKLLYTNTKRDQHDWSSSFKSWRSVPFKHPSTFESMALVSELKEKIMRDLTKFMNAGAAYKRQGKAWKRGYLLYGPPGTGKSSLIGAIANFTGYDVYDLELTEVESNGQLRKLLMDIGNKSVIVIEDIDCSIKLEKRGEPAEEAERSDDTEKKKKKKNKQRVTLSGLLNFTDGLWSSCGSERIIIFTTNHVEKLDPALLRPGRMDMKIPLSFATFEAFKVLAWTHLGIKQHEQFGEIEKLLSVVDDIEITPADVTEILVQNGGEDDVESALCGLIAALKDPAHRKKEEPKQNPEISVNEDVAISTVH